MRNNITINYRKNTIEISNTFSKKTAIFGSDEYKQLKEAKADFPTFRVVIKSASNRKFEDKITMKDILYYVEKHSGKDSPEKHGNVCTILLFCLKCLAKIIFLCYNQLDYCFC